MTETRAYKPPYTVRWTFTERQLSIIKTALLSARTGDALAQFRSWEVDALVGDIDDLLMFEREAKRERKKSLAIERKIRNSQ
jgi:hypothetical protein